MGAYVSFYACFVDHFVEVVSSDPRLDLSGSNVEDFSSQSADFPHTILLLLVEDGDVVAAHELLLGPWYAICSVVGTWYRLWQRAL